MTKPVREILSWYASDNSGTLTNLARLLNHGKLVGTGKMVILPVDQGFEHGPARSFAPFLAGTTPSASPLMRRWGALTSEDRGAVVRARDL